MIFFYGLVCSPIFRPRSCDRVSSGGQYTSHRFVNRCRCLAAFSVTGEEDLSLGFLLVFCLFVFCASLALILVFEFEVITMVLFSSSFVVGLIFFYFNSKQTENFNFDPVFFNLLLFVSYFLFEVVVCWFYLQ